jgi:hypothetical protein
VDLEMSEAGYSGTPLPKKLGIKAASKVAVLGATEDFFRLLDPMPPDVEIEEVAGHHADVTVVFVERAAALVERLDRLEPLLARGQRLWIAWPKLASGRPTDLTENVVREAGLGVGLVDTKVCAIDATWSGLCFMRRRSQVDVL